nr:uncharacterized protein LOC105343759 [Crassostrea gigas]
MEFFSALWKQIQHISESVFMGMCLIAGTSQQVAIRRETNDIMEMELILVKPYEEPQKMLSGSKKEGFRMKGSDWDTMVWLNDHRVIWNMSQSHLYNTGNTILILSQSSESPPGYTLLQQMSLTNNLVVHTAHVRINDGLYISSSKYKQLICYFQHSDTTLHGPCVRSGLAGEEYDTANCFVSDFWPPSASSWIDRCQKWPDAMVVEDIVRNGCHFVAIGHPLGLHENDEWRISFSQAEFKIVYSMNHCQFLTYGLLKLFLKEVINHQPNETNELLCSYHMKTTLSLAIQQNTLPHWCPQNLLVGFWVCIKLLLKWVYEGFCPNFFIPQNNLFLTKVYGSAQNRLFLQLHELYNEGLACLLQSSSIRSYIIDVLYNPRLYIYTDENIIRSEVDNDLELFFEINCLSDLKSPDIYRCMKHIKTIEHLTYLPLSQYESVMLQKHTVFTLQHTAFVIHNADVNKRVYISGKMSSHMLQLAAKFGDIADMFYIAIYFYKTLRYMEALSVIEMTKVKLARPYLMYRRHVDREWYMEAVGGQSWSTKMRQAVARDVRLYNNICYINELMHEQHSSLENGSSLLHIPLFVFLHFLEFLCYKNIESTTAQTTLN